MLIQSRRIHKLPKITAPRPNPLMKKKIIVEKKVEAVRCRFKLIPFDPKILDSESIHWLYGDIPLMKINEKLVTDLSFLNEFKIFRDLKAIEMYRQKVLVMKLEDKTHKDSSTWLKLVHELKRSSSPNLLEWAEVIQTFSQKYQRILGRQCRKKPKSSLRRNYFSEVTKSTEDKKKMLFETYPCIQLKYRLKNHQNLLNEIIVSENFLKDIGYSIESFAYLVLQEGIPQLFALEDENHNSLDIQELMKRYFTLGTENFESSELESSLILKHGYVRKIKYKNYGLVNYENKSFGIDIIFAILSKEEPSLNTQGFSTLEVTENFMQNMMMKEEESRHFLATFYNVVCTQRYIDKDQICKIREISDCDEESFIVKKDEDF